MAAADSVGIGPTEPLFSWIAAASEGSAARTAASLSRSDMKGETTHLSYGRCRAPLAVAPCVDVRTGGFDDGVCPTGAAGLDRVAGRRARPPRRSDRRRSLAPGRHGQLGVRRGPPAGRDLCRLA